MKRLNRSRKWWTEEETKLLLETYEELPCREIAKKLGRSIMAIQRKANKLGLRKRKDVWTSNRGRVFWTKEKDDFLRANYDKHTNKELAEMLGVKAKNPSEAVQHRAARLGLKKTWRLTKDGKTKFWSNEEYETFIKMREEGKSLVEIARKLGRPYSTVATYVKRLGLTPSSNVTLLHKRGREGEELARAMLEKMGMKVVAYGRKGAINQPYDYLVEKNGNRFAVEVKHGYNMAVRSGQLRRLLETEYEPLIMYIDMDGEVYISTIKKVMKIGQEN